MRAKTINKRNQFLQAGKELFFEKGYISVSVKEICDKLDTTTGSFYFMFSSKEKLLEELLIESFQTLRSRGECFTYLMPADENYYLPFDFRFGMTQIEQEVEYLPDLYI